MRALVIGSAFLALTADPVAAQPARPKLDRINVETVGAVKPLAPATDDTPTRKLQKEAYNTRLAQVQALVGSVRRRESGQAEFAAAIRRLAYTEAELFDDPAAGVRWLDLWVDILTDLERVYQKMLAQGNFEEEIVSVQLARINAQLDILRLKELKDPGRRTDPEARLALHAQRVKLLEWREARAKRAYDAGALVAADYLEAKAARVEAELELVRLKEAIKAE